MCSDATSPYLMCCRLLATRPRIARWASTTLGVAACVGEVCVCGGGVCGGDVCDGVCGGEGGHQQHWGWRRVLVRYVCVCGGGVCCGDVCDGVCGGEVW